MAKIQRKFLILDILLVNIAMALAFLIRYDGRLPARYTDHLIPITFVVTLVSIGILFIFRIYNRLWQYASMEEFFSLGIGCMISTLFVKLVLSFFGPWVHLSVLAIFGMLQIGLIALSRVLMRIYYTRNRMQSDLNSSKVRRVMVVGAGDAGAMVIKELKRHPELNLKPVAVIDDNVDKHHSKIMGVPIVGSRSKIEETTRKLNIDEIIVAIPSASKALLKDILNECKKTKCKLKTLPGMYELIDGKVTIQQIRDVQIEDLLGREPVVIDLDEVCGYLSDQVVLVTGGGGSIGSELCRQIARFAPKKLLILDIYENNAYELEQELKRKYPLLDLEVLIASVRERERMEAIFREYRPSVVFHAAAHKHVPLMEHNPTEAIKNNVFGTLNVAECADKYGSKRFVLISTDKAVNPTNIMGATKRIAEMIIQGMDRISKTEYVAVRFGNVLGSSGSVIPLFKKQIAEGGPVTVTHPEITRFFMTIPEAVQLVLQAGSMAKGGEIFILDMGEPVKIVDLARDLIRLSGFEPDVDIEIKFTGLRPGEKLYEELLMAEEGLTATKHKKIYIGKPCAIDMVELRGELEKLRFICNGPKEDIGGYIKRLVPTYSVTVAEVAATIDK